MTWFSVQTHEQKYYRDEAHYISYPKAALCVLASLALGYMAFNYINPRSMASLNINLDVFSLPSPPKTLNRVLNIFSDNLEKLGSKIGEFSKQTFKGIGDLWEKNGYKKHYHHPPKESYTKNWVYL